ncbi:MAG: TonB-dependent receptor [Bacteroidia bacterium]|nr:TonB-dependent receptor [Bacteroidia bacterium]
MTGLRPTTQGEAVSSGMLGWGAKLDGEPTINFDGVQRPYVAHPDRIKEFYRDGTAFTNTVALSGGNGKGSFRASFSNLKSSGITPNNEYAKRIANLGLNYAITEKLKLSVNANYTSEENENPPQVGIQGSGEANFLYRMSTSIPLSAFSESVINPVNGITELPTSGFQTTLINPYFSMPRMFFNEDKNRLLATTTLRYELTKWLFVQGRFNYDFSSSFHEFNTPTGQGTNNPFNSTGVEFNGNYTINTSRGSDVNADFLIGATKQFGAFSVDASFGGNTLRQTSMFTNQTVTDFVALGVYSLGNGVTTTTNNAGIGYRARVNSLYGILEVGYKNILFLNLTDRQDWFSTLNPSNNTKNYPSVSGSFIFSELLQNQTWLSYGKLRGAWAQVGSSNGAGYAEGLLTYTVLPQGFNGQKLGNINNTVAPNPGLIPFLVTEKEIGLEFKFFNRRVSFDVAAYDKTTTDQILTVAISNATGYVGTKQNVGEMQTEAWSSSWKLCPLKRMD